MSDIMIDWTELAEHAFWWLNRNHSLSSTYERIIQMFTDISIYMVWYLPAQHTRI